MHLRMYHPVQSFEGFKEPYLICSINTPGHVTDFREMALFFHVVVYRIVLIVVHFLLDWRSSDT